MSDAFAAAAAKVNETAAPAGNGSTGLTDPEDGGSSLFGGEKLYSLLNKFVMPGQTVTGIITKAPVDRQSRGVDGKLKFWDAQKEEVTSVDTGRPLKDTVIVLQTEYRLTAQDIADRNIDPLDVEDDKGLRGVFANGDLKAAIMRACKAARVRSEKEMVGMRLTITRGKKIPIGNGKTKWVENTAVLERV